MSVLTEAGATLVRAPVGSVARAVPAVPVIVTRSAMRRSRGVVRGSVQMVRGSVQAARALGGVTAGSSRQWWNAAEGRAQIEVRLPDTVADASAACRGLSAALNRLPGVDWAKVDPVTSRAVVRFDPAVLGTAELVAAVAAAESRMAESVATDEPITAVGDAGSPVRSARHLPGFPLAGREEAVALGITLAGLAVATARRALPFPPLSPIATAAVVLVDNQPRLRGRLSRAVGTAGADLALAVAAAAVHGLGGGVSSLGVDGAARVQSWWAERARAQTFDSWEDQLCGAQRPVPDRPLSVPRRPVPVPLGAVERFADRAAAASLLGAGALGVLTRNVNTAARTVLVGAPKAAHIGRRSFADALTAGLARRGVLGLDRDALEVLDRVDSVVIDAEVLLTDRPMIVGATAVAEHWTRGHVWSAGQRLLSGRRGLSVPPPASRNGEKLQLVGGPAAGDRGPNEMLLTEDGVTVGTLIVGREVDPYATALLAAARAGGLQIVLTEDPSAEQLAAHADRTIAVADNSEPGVDAEYQDGGADPLAREVRAMQAAGHVVAVVTSAEPAAAAADVGIGIVPRTGRVPWTADILCGPELIAASRILDAVPLARAQSRRGVTLAAGATFLGALLLAVGARRAGGATLPVNAAAASALASGHLAARRLLTAPDPLPVAHTPWHCLEPDDVRDRLDGAPAANDAAPPDSAHGHLDPAPGGGAPAGRHVAALARPLAVAGMLVRNVRAELADPLTPVLATGAAASAVIGSPSDAVLVGGVLGANAVISGVQRLRADQAMGALLHDQRLTARVVACPHGMAALPAGVSRTVAADLLRAGDVLELRTGDVVPADARLLACTDLELDESSLTGESGGVPKQVSATPGADLPDRACMVYEGTTVLGGSGRAAVVAVGSATEAGRAVALAATGPGPAGMQTRLEELTRRGLPITLLGGAVITGLALLRRQSLRAAIASGVSVAVAAVPEGLPLVATVAQMSAARRLSQRGILVRSPRTVEALGRVDTVCFDKTGTLTEGRLRLVRVAALGGEVPLDAPQSRRILRAAARACPRPQPGRSHAHATDQAILEGVQAAIGNDAAHEWEELGEIPFQSDRGFSAALGRIGGGVRLVVKGAPEVLLPRCTHVRDGAGKRPLTGAARRQAEHVVEQLAGQQLRVLVVARRTLARPRSLGADVDDVVAEELTDDLTLLGFVALADVARSGAADTVAALQAAGLSTVMITGDHPVTARAIAAGLGIPADQVVTGSDLSHLGQEERSRLTASASVFARVSPEQKLRIVAALQHAGRVVAMTGDGANDAAAIRLADVGIGMAAHGSSSARNAADLVLIDPDITLLRDALIEGRAMWRRVRDAVAILLGGNAGEVAFTLAGTALAGRAPLGTRQFLLVNMLTDLLPAMAIALAATPQDEPSRQELLESGQPSLGAPLRRDIALRGTTTAAGALAAWSIGRLSGTRARADTMALAALVGTQLGQTLVVSDRSPVVIATSLGSMAALAAVIQTPVISQFFGCRPLGPIAWGTVLLSAGTATAAAVIAPEWVSRRRAHPAKAADQSASAVPAATFQPPSPLPGGAR